MENIYNYTELELREKFLSMNLKSFQANQVFDWVYDKEVNDFSQMTNLGTQQKELLVEEFNFGNLKIVEVNKSKTATKYLIELFDQNFVEAVLLKQNYGNSICLSSQVGCNFGCEFCESGKLKKVRDLTAGEMVATLMLIQKEKKERISHVVIMGIGEPFDNYKEVMKFVAIINEPKGLAIGARHITISTAGIIPKIKEFAQEKRQINLAISLHASNDALRSEIMPINKVYPLRDLIKEIKEYIEITNRRVTFEYILLKDKNDSNKNALELIKLIRGMNAYVNLIPYNETSGNYQASSKVKVMEFYDILKKGGINVTIRREMGKELKAACGQLASRRGGTA